MFHRNLTLQVSRTVQMIDINDLLSSARTVAVVGCSRRASRTSQKIARYLKEQGYTVIPVNPYAEEILGERCHPNLQSIGDDVSIDIVNVFRRPAFTLDVVEDVISRSGSTRHEPVIWTQIGVSSEEAEHRARDAGLAYIANRCIMVEHARRTG